MRHRLRRWVRFGNVGLLFLPFGWHNRAIKAMEINKAKELICYSFVSESIIPIVSIHLKENNPSCLGLEIPDMLNQVQVEHPVDYGECS